MRRWILLLGQDFDAAIGLGDMDGLYHHVVNSFMNSYYHDLSDLLVGQAGILVGVKIPEVTLHL